MFTRGGEKDVFGNTENAIILEFTVSKFTTMSVFSVDPRAGGPVTNEALDSVCTSLGVKIKDEEKEDYRKLLAVFDESAEELMAMPDYIPEVDLNRFPRKDIQRVSKENNPYGAWATKCSIKDTQENDGPLAGKTVVLKDMISVKDVPMLMGTEFVTGFVPNTDATVTTRLLEAGAHIVGKSVCENLCHSATSHSAPTGVVENPFVKGYSAGGSSSGSGVLVALGEVDMSIGADQGGSVRIPATNCGIVGLKPTFGLIPYTGCGSNEPSNDHLGPMTRNVLDNALLLQNIAGSDNIDDRSFAVPPPSRIPNFHTMLRTMMFPQDLTDIKIGILKEGLEIPVLDERVKNCFLKACQTFRGLNATVSEVSIPIHAKGTAIWNAVSKVGGYLTKMYGAPGHRAYNMPELQTAFVEASHTQERWDKAYVASKNIYTNGVWACEKYPALLAKAQNLSRQLRDSYDEALKDLDVLIMPTLPYVATSHPKANALPLEHVKKQVGLTSNTCPFNQSGHPALTIPIGMLSPREGPAAGKDDAKLPVGMQIVAKWYDEVSGSLCRVCEKLL